MLQDLERSKSQVCRASTAHSIGLSEVRHFTVIVSKSLLTAPVTIQLLGYKSKKIRSFPKSPSSAKTKKTLSLLEHPLTSALNSRWGGGCEETSVANLLNIPNPS